MLDTELITKCGLLHDIGKVCQRATGERRTHSAIGADFIQSCMEKTDEGDRLLREEGGRALLHSIRYHHWNALQHAHLPTNDPAYIVYEADNIAAGADRREKPEEGEDSSRQRFNSHAMLENIFNTFSSPNGNPSEKSYYALRFLNADQNGFQNYPYSPKAAEKAAGKGEYSEVLGKLKANFVRRNPISMSSEELLRILEDTIIYVPSSTNTEEVCDISLYDHIKMTGAVAAAMLRYFKSQGICDYKKACVTEAKRYREDKMFLLVSGDFSGIQKFIYRIPNKGAMHMLRGRSFYLEIALENMIDMLLEDIGLSRANLIYSGGGHFYMLTDNSEETKQILKQGFQTINQGLLRYFGTSLYLGGSWAETSAAELMDIRRDGGTASLFRKVSQKVSETKNHRYGEDDRRNLFDEQSAWNAVREDSRECGLCHRAVSYKNLKPYEAYGDLANERDDSHTLEACSICNALYHLGKVLVDHQKYVLAVTEKEAAGMVPLPSPRGVMWLSAVSETEAEKLHADGQLKHIYDLNGSNTSKLMKTRLWIADYAASEGSHMLDFQELAEQSGAGEEGKGIKRLGVLRADVDWLGAAFIAGLPKEKATLSRYAALSRSLALFFKFLITKICEKQLPQGQQPFYLFQDKGENARKIHAVYAGGDDLFLVGAWDDLLEMAVDLRRAFASYTNGKLSFSAGLGLFSPSYPISRMASMTGMLEERAKSEAGKDHIALWGSEWQYSQDSKGNVSAEELTPVFSWKELTDGVVGEKMKFLLAHFNLMGVNEAKQDRLTMGKSLLYHLLTLLPQSGQEKFNLARFAYLLARLEPGRDASVTVKQGYQEIRSQLYQWATAPADREELRMAIHMIIYRMRDK